MARSITIKAIDRRANKVYVRVGKAETEIAASSVAEFREVVRQRISELDDDLLLFLSLAAYLARDPTMANPSQLVGRTATLDLAGRVNYPDSVFRIA